ncbi:MAG TPA: hypothetical protein VGO93_13775 [Candidatus Xenobia bacterium]|jgi:TolA-binding protein
MRRWLVWLALLTSVAWAQAPLPPVQPPGRAGAGGGAVRAQVQQIRQRYQAQREQLRAHIKQQRDELGEMIRNHAPQSQTEPRLQAIIASEGQLETMLLQEYYELSAVLPPVAREKYTQRVADQVMRLHRPGPSGSPSGVSSASGSPAP